MEVGDCVESTDPHGNPLRSGAEWYPHATVASVEPFILVSDDGDMLWSVTRTPDNVRVIGKATARALENALDRVARDRAGGTLTIPTTRHAICTQPPNEGKT